MKTNIALLVLLGSLILGASPVLPRTITIEVGKTAKVQAPFSIGAGANSNPRVMQATLLDAKTVEFKGREAGQASYVLYDAADREQRVEFEVIVSEPQEKPPAR